MTPDGQTDMASPRGATAPKNQIHPGDYAMCFKYLNIKMVMKHNDIII